jgi:hypothetical protein
MSAAIPSQPSADQEPCSNRRSSEIPIAGLVFGAQVVADVRAESDEEMWSDVEQERGEQRDTDDERRFFLHRLASSDLSIAVAHAERAAREERPRRSEWDVGAGASEPSNPVWDKLIPEPSVMTNSPGAPNDGAGGSGAGGGSGSSWAAACTGAGAEGRSKYQSSSPARAEPPQRSRTPTSIDIAWNLGAGVITASLSHLTSRNPHAGTRLVFMLKNARFPGLKTRWTTAAVRPLI